ncbi:MAG: hypothetical protein ABI778_07075 [Ignavibacteriota bacterium]
MRLYRCLALLALALTLTASSVSSQIISGDKSYSLIFPRSGDGFSATILRVDADSLVIFTNTINSIAKKDVSKILLHHKRQNSKGFAMGSILGMYAMNYFLGTATGQPGGFLYSGIYGSRYSETYSNSGNTLSVVGIAFLGVLAGGGLGYILDNSSSADQDVTYIFGPSPELDADQWEKLKEAAEHSVRKTKWHLGLSGAVVLSAVGKSYRDQLSANGYTTSSYYYGSGGSLSGYEGLQAASDMNWLRALSLSYSAADEFQLGLRYAFLGEPAFVYYKQAPTSNSPTKSYAVGMRIDGKGYYATAGYSRSFGVNENFEFDATVGVGFASMNFDLSSRETIDSSYRTISTTNAGISQAKNSLSGMISASISYFLYDSMSMGFEASYYYAGSLVADEIPLVSLPSHKITFGNADVGFNIGLHF